MRNTQYKSQKNDQQQDSFIIADDQSQAIPQSDDYNAIAIQAAKIIVQASADWSDWSRVYGHEMQGTEQSVRVDQNIESEDKFKVHERELEHFQSLQPQMIKFLADTKTALRQTLNDVLDDLRTQLQQRMVAQIFIPKMMIDLEAIFKSATDKLDESFENHLNGVDLNINNILSDFRALNVKIARNYLEMAKKNQVFSDWLQNQLDKFSTEKERYENDKKEVAKVNNFLESDIMKLNVGGTHHLVSSRKVLCHVPGSSLEKMFSGLHILKKVDEEVFIDRDGTTFECLLNYLRNDRRIWPDFKNEHEETLFQQELRYWGIKDDMPMERKIRQRFNKQLIEMLLETPGETNGEMGERGGELISDEAKITWERIGPLKLHELAKNTQIEINFDLGYHQSLVRLAIDGSPLKVYGQAYFQSSKSITNESTHLKKKKKVHNKQGILEDYMQILNSQETLNLKELHSQALGMHSKQYVQQHIDQDIEQTFGNNTSIQNEQSIRNARGDPYQASGYGDQSSVGRHQYTDNEHLATLQQSQTLQFPQIAQTDNNQRYISRYGQDNHSPSVRDLAETPHSKTTSAHANPKIVVINQDNSKSYSEYNMGTNSRIQATNIGIVRIVKDAQFCVTALKEHIYEGQVNDQMQPHGFGRQIYRNGDVYTGQFLNGIKHGIGRYIEYDAYQKDGKGREMEGDYQNGIMTMRRRVFR